MEKSSFPGFSRCSICNELIRQNEIDNHIRKCQTKSSKEIPIKHLSTKKSIIAKREKQCIICNQSFDEDQYIRHIQTCDESEADIKQKTCIICSKSIRENDYIKHLQTCL